jgi:hypothetical protein
MHVRNTQHVTTTNSHLHDSLHRYATSIPVEQEHQARSHQHGMQSEHANWWLCLPERSECAAIDPTALALGCHWLPCAPWLCSLDAPESVASIWQFAQQSECREYQLDTTRNMAIQSNPIQSNPIQSNPIQSNPIQSNAMQCNAIQSNQ